MSEPVANKRRSTTRLAWVLWLIAAVLAFSAWTIEFFKEHTFRWPSLVLGLACLTLTLVSLLGSRRR